MAAVIRRMSRCRDRPDADAVRTLLRLPGELRAQPELERNPAVLAALAEANFCWVNVFNQSRREGHAGSCPDPQAPPTRH